MKYLIDTCIWRDFNENRISKTNKPIGEYAAQFFLSILKKNVKIYYSKTLTRELSKDYTESDIINLLKFFEFQNKLIRVDITKEEFLEAKDLAIKRDLPFVDCLNAIHSRNYNCVLITRDIHFFQKLSDIAESFKPEDIT